MKEKTTVVTGSSLAGNRVVVGQRIHRNVTAASWARVLRVCAPIMKGGQPSAFNARVWRHGQPPRPHLLARNVVDVFTPEPKTSVMEKRRRWNDTLKRREEVIE